MCGMDLAAARFPLVGDRDPFYESFYLTAYDPVAPRALWLRHTVWKSPDGTPVGSVWRTLFDLDGPHADKWSTPELAAGPLIRVGDATLEPDRATAPDWEIAWTGDDPAFAHLPLPFLYGAPLPRTKSVSLRPRLTFSGEVRVDGRTVDLTGWTGMLGHNWGSEHAERWIWLRGAGEDWLVDMVLGRLKVGPLSTPWIANGVLELDGRRRRLGGLGRPVRVVDREDGCHARVSGTEIEVSAPVSSLTGWTYSDPAGGHHDVLHSSVAGMAVRATGVVRECAHGATYEIGRREAPTSVEMLPFSDP
jgi:hypothetical protein